MLKKPQHCSETRSGELESDCIEGLRNALRSGLKALDDPTIESRVREYFEKNPTFSRDPVHVAAVACRFAEERDAKKNLRGVRT